VSSFLVPRNLSHHMDRQARTGDTVLVKSREITGRSQTLTWLLMGEGVKTTQTKIHCTPLSRIIGDVVMKFEIETYDHAGKRGGAGEVSISLPPKQQVNNQLKCLMAKSPFIRQLG
jgi:hypothetical protein